VFGGNTTARAAVRPAPWLVHQLHRLHLLKQQRNSERRSLHTKTMQACTMPWDRPARANASERVRAVFVKHLFGQEGNKLFSIAAGVSLAEAMQLPLFIPSRTSLTMARKGFPCLRTSPSIQDMRREDIEVVRPNEIYGINFQDLSIWGTAEASGLPLGSSYVSTRWLGLMRRSFIPTAGGRAIAELPGGDDLVIHFRDLRDCGGWKPSADGNGTRSTYRVNHWRLSTRWFYGLNLYATPIAFYHSVIAMHRLRFPNGRIWIVSQACDREHPTVKSLRANWPVEFLAAHNRACNSASSCNPAILDFMWMQAARHLVLTPSTFGWWSAFLSNRAATIYFPIYPAFSPWGAHMWCHMIPEDDPRYVFYDMWTNSTWHGGGYSGRAARRRCDVYVRACLQAHVCAADRASAVEAQHVLPLETIDKFTYKDNNYSYWSVSDLIWRRATGLPAAT
jgi:hypothetical protein